MTTPYNLVSQWYDHGGLGDPDVGHTTDGGRVYGITKAVYAECERYGCSPVAVIDPEDRDQAVRLMMAFDRALGSETHVKAQDDAMQAALRSLMEPPRPKEPTGLGAVVEASAYTAEVRKFVRVTVKTGCWSDDSGTWHKWAELDDPVVVSQGVNP